MEEPIDSLSLTTTTEIPSISSSTAREFLWMASIKAPHFKQTQRAPLDIIAVIDRSGSMSGEKINLCKETMKFVISQLDSGDKLALIDYDNNVSLRFNLTKMNSDGKTLAEQLVDKINTGGSTNLAGGLLKGIQLMHERTEKNEVSSVLLLTDGQANVGLQKLPEIVSAITNPTNLRSYATVQNNSQSQESHLPLPCTVYTFGYGSDHDPNLLKGIAEAGNGVYYFIKDNKDVPEAFADCLGGLLSVAAQNITLKFEVEAPVKIKKIITKFKMNEITPGLVYELSMGDIQSEEQRDIIILTDLPALAEETPNQYFATVSLNYFNVLTSTLETKTIKAAIARPSVEPSGQQRNYELDKQNNRLIAAEAMKQATEYGNAKNLAKAREIIASAVSQIKESVTGEDPFCKSLIADLQLCAAGLKDEVSYAKEGSPMLQNSVQAHYYQRSTNVQMKSQAGYQTSARNYMQSQQQQKFQ